MAHEHLADLLDLDVEVLSEYHREVAEWVWANLTERARVIDVGAGTVPAPWRWPGSCRTLR
jgi:hypothetical protein